MAVRRPFFLRLVRFWQALTWPQVPSAPVEQDLLGITWIELYFWFMAWSGTRPPLLPQEQTRSSSRRYLCSRRALYYEDAKHDTTPVPLVNADAAAVAFAASSRRLLTLLGTELWPGSTSTHAASLRALVPAFQARPGLERRPRPPCSDCQTLLLDFLVEGQPADLRDALIQGNITGLPTISLARVVTARLPAVRDLITTAVADAPIAVKRACNASSRSMGAGAVITRWKLPTRHEQPTVCYKSDLHCVCSTSHASLRRIRCHGSP